jgi:hypothetical protein
MSEAATLDLNGALPSSIDRAEVRRAILYSGLAIGIVAGIALSTYFWRQHVRALNLLKAPPLDRAEELIASCERKLEDIERTLADMQGVRATNEKEKSF